MGEGTKIGYGEGQWAPGKYVKRLGEKDPGGKGYTDPSKWKWFSDLDTEDRLIDEWA